MSQPNSLPAAGDVIAGKYRIDHALGQGGMGAIFAATHLLTGKQRALKWMQPHLAHESDSVQRFLREARAAGRIKHPNVVDVFDVGTHNECYFLVLELLEGRPLSARLAEGAMPVAQLLRCLIPAMAGIEAAHEQGVIHRDLKPDNLFLCEEQGQVTDVKVLDFGISKIVSSEDEQELDPTLTRPGAVIGTPFYMSPEQLRSKPIDARTDVYSMGVILYEAIGGRVPYHADQYNELIFQIAQNTPTPLTELRPDIPKQLAQVIMRAMNPEADARPGSMQQLIAALTPFTLGKDGEQLGVTALEQSLGGRSMTPWASAVQTARRQHMARRRARLLAATAAVLVVAAFVGAWVLRPVPPESPPPGPVGESAVPAAPAPPAASAAPTAQHPPQAEPPAKTQLPTDTPPLGVEPQPVKVDAPSDRKEPKRRRSARRRKAQEPKPDEPAPEQAQDDDSPFRFGPRRRTPTLDVDEF